MGGDRQGGRDPLSPFLTHEVPSPISAEPLEGPVSVCIDRRALSLDRPFTYLLHAETGAGVGSFVKVPFKGHPLNGWILGPTEDVPDRVLEVTRLVSRVRFFDPRMLEVLRWASERYVASLASVIHRSHPPRVVSEEGGSSEGAVPDPLPGGRSPASFALTSRYRNGERMLESISGSSAAFLQRPAPGEEGSSALEAVLACLAAGRKAIVLVPDLDPLPDTARAVLEAVGERGVLFAGGDRRERYRTWLRILAQGYDVVVGTRPAVFAPVHDLGLVWISRENHPGHREERAPYYHVRDIALARSRIEGATVVMSAFCPSAEAVVAGAEVVSPAGRRWPPVEVVQPGPEGKAPRLMSALKAATGAFLLEPVRGYGVARVCRECREPAACSSCGGLLRLSERKVACTVCGAAGCCRSCGSESFGISRGGSERVEEWATGVTSLPVRPASGPPGPGRVSVGGVDAVKDHGPVEVDLVGMLNLDFSADRPGLSSPERALAVWMEAASWAGASGRVIVQTRRPGDPAIQALVSGNPERFYRHELPRRADAGFAAGNPVFRVRGSAELETNMRALDPASMLTTRSGDETICLITVRPEDVGAFGERARSLSESGVVTRVEAEPHL